MLLFDVRSDGKCVIIHKCMFKWDVFTSFDNKLIKLIR